MLLTQERLRALAKALDAARRGAVEDTDLYCTHPVDHPTVAAGTETIRRSRRTKKSVTETQGPVVHGRGALGIDPSTGEIACARCQGEGS